MKTVMRITPQIDGTSRVFKYEMEDDGPDDVRVGDAQDWNWEMYVLRGDGTWLHVTDEVEPADVTEVAARFATGDRGRLESWCTP